jgi:hypothetical protein
MREKRFSTSALAPAVMAMALWSHASAGAGQTSFETLNVCERVPPADVAAVVSGRALDGRPVNVKGLTAARCVYGIEIAGARRAFVIWINPAADFEGLRKATDPPVEEIKGVGDEAFAITDKDTKRIQLTARARGKVTVQVTSERMEWAQAVAKVALSKF